MAVEYAQGSDLPDLGLVWKDTAGNLINFSDGWTFEAKVGRLGEAAQFSKSAGITGAATSPNVLIEWATTGELNTLSPGTYTLQLAATRTDDGRTRLYQTRIRIKKAIA